MNAKLKGLSEKADRKHGKGNKRIASKPGGETIGSLLRGLHALDGVDFQISGSEIVAVIGPNGDDKTSFINSINRHIGRNHLYPGP